MVDLVPKLNLPLLMTSFKRALMLSWAFFCNGARAQSASVSTRPRGATQRRGAPPEG